ncbi:type II toxin-antitoxin system VapC family toxin [Methylosinus sp. LW4]|uniref:type II toxin-antitoxin system VapC family toxin n=1 Tax=Methylosinus sp. LW4 TaxID=136993 RepID=UPI000380C445|nr:type II toxin-antitoxin system VapC family toxin [Methylosinus sp. LW4]
MKLLLDTHLLLWAASEPQKLPHQCRILLEEATSEPIFSVASIWEIAVKNGLKRDDFRVDTAVFRRCLLENGYSELPISGRHAAAVEALPPLHKDPFDRMLVAQAIVEGVELLTADRIVALYPGPIRKC